MKYLISVIILTFIGCQTKDENEFDYLVFSDGGIHYSYSIKFSTNDTIYMQKRFPVPTEYFYSIIKSPEKDSIKALVNKIKFKKYKSSYMQDNLCDGNTFQFYKKINDSIRWITVYGHEAPKEIYEFYASFRAIKENHKFRPVKINKKLDDFKWYIPIAPPPPIKK